MTANVAAQSWEYLRQEARASGRDAQALATNFVIERFMVRLMQADEKQLVTIKGGQAMGLFFGNPMRPTKDLDINFDADPDDPRSADRALDIILGACERLEDDGLKIDLKGVTVERRNHKGRGKGGLRITIPASVHTSRVPFVIDVGIGNEMTFDPATITVPGVLGGRKSAPPPLDARLYPIENSIAEKLASKFEDGRSSIRHKDFYDLWVYIITARRLGNLAFLSKNAVFPDQQSKGLAEQVKERLVNGSLLEMPEIPINPDCLERLGLALHRTTESRGTSIPDDVEAFLQETFAKDALQSTQFSNWCRKNSPRFVHTPPGDRGGDKKMALTLLLNDIGADLERIATIAREQRAAPSP